MQLVHETRPQVRRDRLLRLFDVEVISGLKKSTIYLLMKRGEFPRCVKITSRCVAWPESLVLQFVQDRIADAERQSTIAQADAERQSAIAYPDANASSARGAQP